MQTRLCPVCTVPHTVSADQLQISKVKLLLCDSPVKGLPLKLLHPFAPNPLQRRPTPPGVNNALQAE